MLFALAYKDLKFDRLMTICQIAAITCILAPLLMLFSLRYGILHELEERLLSDPNVLSLTLDTSYRLNDSFFNELRSQDEVGFVVPEIAALSALVDIKFKGSAKRVSILPTEVNDPIVINSGLIFSHKEHKLRINEAFISEDLSIAHNLKPGDNISVFVSRVLNGERQTKLVTVHLRGIIKQRYVRNDSLLVSLDTLNALDDYRNGYEPKFFSNGSYEKKSTRYYAKFRLYAKDLDSVIPLYYKLIDQKLNVSSKVKEIENLKAIDHVLNFVFAVVAVVAVTGGALASVGLMLSSLKSKKQSFTLLRMMGLTKHKMYGLVLIEGLIISLIGFLLAFLLYLLGSFVFNAYFNTLIDGAFISYLTLVHLFYFLGATIFGALLIALVCAYTVFIRVNISDVLREA